MRTSGTVSCARECDDRGGLPPGIGRGIATMEVLGGSIAAALNAARKGPAPRRRPDGLGAVFFRSALDTGQTPAPPPL